jgi:hypothetical protein
MSYLNLTDTPQFNKAKRQRKNNLLITIGLVDVFVLEGELHESTWSVSCLSFSVSQLLHLSRVEPLAALCRELYSGNGVRSCSTLVLMQSDFRKTIVSLLLMSVLCASFAPAEGIVAGSIFGTVEDPAGALC